MEHRSTAPGIGGFSVSFQVPTILESRTHPTIECSRKQVLFCLLDCAIVLAARSVTFTELQPVNKQSPAQQRSNVQNQRRLGLCPLPTGNCPLPTARPQPATNQGLALTAQKWRDFRTDGYVSSGSHRLSHCDQIGGFLPPLLPPSRRHVRKYICTYVCTYCTFGAPASLPPAACRCSLNSSMRAGNQTVDVEPACISCP